MSVLRQSVRGYVLAGVFVGALGFTALLPPVVRAQAPAASAPSARVDAATLLKEAREAEAAYQFDVALDRLYTLQLEQPRTPDALNGRLLLARLLTLVNDLPSAILQAQALSDEPTATAIQRAQALELATAAGRRLRTTLVVYKNPEVAATRGLVEIKEPTSIVPERDGSFVVVDRGGKRLFRIKDDTLSPVPLTEPEPSAAVQLPDGTLVIGVKPERNKNASIVTQPAGKPVPTTYAEGGRMRPITKVMAMAVNSAGDVFIVADDYDKGLLRCKAGATDCAPWGPPGELRTVKVGASDFVYTLDSKQQTIQVLDNGGRQMATVGPKVDYRSYAAATGIANVTGATYEFKKIADIAIDQTYTLYALDQANKQVAIIPLRLGEGGTLTLTAEVKGTVDISPDDRTAFGMKTPSAIAVTPSGALIVAGGSTSRLVRFR